MGNAQVPGGQGGQGDRDKERKQERTFFDLIG